MRLSTTTSRRRTAARVAVPAIAVLTAVSVALVAGGAQAATPVPLATADAFVVLAGSTITNTGPTTLNGDIGLFPGSAIEDLGTITLNGTNHAGDTVTQGAKTDLVAAYDNAAGQTPVAVSVELGGLVLPAGAYASGGALALTGTLTLDAAGDPNAVFIFQSASDLITATDSSVSLINGAQACNVYWQVTSSATLGVRSAFSGTIMALTSIALQTGATIQGRALARNGAVTLDSNTITRPSCTVAPAPTPTATATAAPQVTTVPTGGVATGDGSSVTSPSSVDPGTVAALIAGLALLAWLPARAVKAGRARSDR